MTSLSSHSTSASVSELSRLVTRGVTIHQWHGSVQFMVLEPRFGPVLFCLLWG